MSMDLTELCSIGGTDIYTTYGAFLAETSAEAHTNMDALLAMPAVKEYTAVDFRERTGEDLPDTLDVQLQAIDRTLQFCILADTDSTLLTRYRDFLSRLVSGWLDFSIKDLRTYRMYYKSADAPEWYRDDPRIKGVILKVTFREPKPQ